MMKGQIPKWQTMRIAGILALAVLILSAPYLNMNLSSADPNIIDNHDGTKTATWSFNEPDSYIKHNVTVEDGDVKLALANGSMYQTDYSEFQRGSPDSNSTITPQGSITLLGDESNLVDNPNFTADTDWQYSLGTQANISAKWTGHSGRFVHESEFVEQFDSMDDAASDMRWWPSGTAPPILSDETIMKTEGNSSLKLTWNPDGDNSKVAGIYRDYDSGTWDWTGSNRLKFWAVTDSGTKSLDVSMTLYNTTTFWSTSYQPLNIDSTWTGNDFDFYFNTAFDGNVTEIDRIEFNFSGVDVQTTIFIDNITLFRQFNDLESSGTSRWWGSGSITPILAVNTLYRVEGVSSLSVAWNPPSPSDWVAVYRDDIGTWDWSQYDSVRIWARSMVTVSGLNMSIFLYNLTDVWISPTINVTDTWKAINFTMSSAFGGDLTNIDRIGIILNGTNAFLPITYIDNITVYRQFDSMDDGIGWSYSGDPSSSFGASGIDNINMIEGTGCFNLSWNPNGNPSAWAHLFKANGPWNWMGYEKLSIRINSNFSGSIDTTISLYNQTSSLNTSPSIWVSVGWNKYIIDMRTVFIGDLSSIYKVEFNFTGVDVQQIYILIDDIELYTHYDNMDDAWSQSDWLPSGDASPSLALEHANRVEGNGSLRLWWNPLSYPAGYSIVYWQSPGAMIFENLTRYNKLKLWANTTHMGSELMMSLSLYNSSFVWDSVWVTLTYGWKEYVFDLSEVPMFIMPDVSRIELKFTGTDSITVAFIDDIRFSYHKIIDHLAYINQSMPKMSFTDPAPTHVILTFDYSILKHSEASLSQFSIWLNDFEVWVYNVSGTLSWTSICLDLSQYMSMVGQYNLSIRLYLNVDSPYKLGFGVDVDNVSIIAPDYKTGVYISAILDPGNRVFWKNLTWLGSAPDETNITVQVRFGNSQTEVNASAWSSPPTIEGFNYQMIQYMLGLNTMNASKAPTFYEINITYERYFDYSYVETEDFTSVENLRWLTFNATSDEPSGTLITYEYSTDSGTNWSSVAGGQNLNLNATLNPTIRFRANLSTVDTIITPILREIEIDYAVLYSALNEPPTILGRIPHQVKPEDSPPWDLNLTGYISDDEPLSNLKWFLTDDDARLCDISGDNVVGNNVLTFTPVKDAFGENHVTIWLEDSFGLKASQDLWINITPVNDAPDLFNPPDINVKADEEYTFDYSPYIDDVDNPPNELTLTVDDNHATVVGLKVTYRYPRSMGNTDIPIVLTVSDGSSEVNATVTINVVSSNVLWGWGWDAIMLLGLGGMGLLALLLSFFVVAPIIRRRKSKFTVEDMFMIHNDGRLIAHYTRALQPDRDEDILAGMLTAVQKFVKDSMGKNEILNRFEFQLQDKNVLVECGKNVYLSVFITGKPPSHAVEELKAFVDDVEEAYADIIPRWTGDVGAFRGLKDLMDRVLVGSGYKRGYWKKLKFLEPEKREMDLEKVDDKEEEEMVDEEIEEFFEELEKVDEDLKSNEKEKD